MWLPKRSLLGSSSPFLEAINPFSLASFDVSLASGFLQVKDPTRRRRSVHSYRVRCRLSFPDLGVDVSHSVWKILDYYYFSVSSDQFSSPSDIANVRIWHLPKLSQNHDRFYGFVFLSFPFSLGSLAAHTSSRALTLSSSSRSTREPVKGVLYFSLGIFEFCRFLSSLSPSFYLSGRGVLSSHGVCFFHESPWHLITLILNPDLIVGRLCLVWARLADRSPVSSLGPCG